MRDAVQSAAGPITAEVRETLDRAVLAWLATADAAGAPNVSPKEVFAALDDRRVVIAHIASPRSVANARVNPQACLAAVDVFRQRGHQLSGILRVVEPDDPGFAPISAPLEAIVAGAFRIRAVLELTVEHVRPVLAPSCVFRPHVTEAEMVDAARRRYGVAP